MERAFFEWRGWDAIGDYAIVFYECVLKVPIGPYNIGEEVSSICVDFRRGTLETYDSAGTVTSTHDVQMVF